MPDAAREIQAEREHLAVCEHDFDRAREAALKAFADFFVEPWDSRRTHSALCDLGDAWKTMFECVTSADESVERGSVEMDDIIRDQLNVVRR